MSEMQWQPIETVPKDGTTIFITRAGWDIAIAAAWEDADGADGPFKAWVFSDAYQYAPGAYDDGVLGWNEDIEDGVMPTHWMPLPTPPAEEPR